MNMSMRLKGRETLYDRIASLCEELRFAPGKRLGGQHEAGSRLYIVQSSAITIRVSMGAKV